MRPKTPIAIAANARPQALASIKRFFDEHMDDSIGDLKATLVLDYLLVELGPLIYNQALAEAGSYMGERAAELPDVLQQPEFPYWPAEREKPKGKR